MNDTRFIRRTIEDPCARWCITLDTGAAPCAGLPAGRSTRVPDATLSGARQVAGWNTKLRAILVIADDDDARRCRCPMNDARWSAGAQRNRKRSDVQVTPVHENLPAETAILDLP